MTASIPTSTPSAPTDLGTCPVCGSGGAQPVVSIASQPVHCNVLWATAEEAVGAPRGDIDLALCTTCGHVDNRSFDPERTTYGATYENSLHHSAVFQGYAEALVDELVERYDLRDKAIVEIGAGQGDFLAMLCTAGSNTGTGFDPSHVGPERVSDAVTVVSEFYGEAFADHPADFIVCRHVLEHIPETADFLSLVRRVVGDRSTPVFFEVPNAMWTLVHGGLWDLIYEHCGYFTPTSLGEAFRRAEFEVDRIDDVFGGQFLTIEAQPRTGRADADGARLEAEIGALVEAADGFAASYRATVDRWSSECAALATSGRRGVIWGAGSKGVTFLNAVPGAGDVIDRAVDINPRKRGMHVAGSGQPIVAPNDLIADAPDDVFVMNPNYRDEIAAQLADLDLDARLHVV